MIRIEGEIVINRPVEEVFDVVSDERNEPRYNPRLLWVEKISSGPIGRGTRFKAATKAMGRPVEMTIEFTEYERPRRLGSSTHMPTMEIRGALRSRVRKNLGSRVERDGDRLESGGLGALDQADGEVAVVAAVHLKGHGTAQLPGTEE